MKPQRQKLPKHVIMHIKAKGKFASAKEIELVNDFHKPIEISPKEDDEIVEVDTFMRSMLEGR